MKNRLFEIKERFIEQIDFAYTYCIRSRNIYTNLTEKSKNSYIKEFKSQYQKYNNNPSNLNPKDDLNKKNLEDDMRKLNIVIKIASQGDFDEKLSLRMAHTFLITLYEGFCKVFFRELYSIDNTKNIEKFNIDNLKSWLKKELNINLKSSLTSWNDLRESYYRRHLIIHCNSIVDAEYIRNVPTTIFKSGDEVVNDITYLEKCARNIIDFINVIFNEITNTCNIPTYSSSSMDYKKILAEYGDLIKRFP